MKQRLLVGLIKAMKQMETLRKRANTLLDGLAGELTTSRKTSARKATVTKSKAKRTTRKGTKTAAKRRTSAASVKRAKPKSKTKTAKSSRTAKAAQKGVKRSAAARKTAASKKVAKKPAARKAKASSRARTGTAKRVTKRKSAKAAPKANATTQRVMRFVRGRANGVVSGSAQLKGGKTLAHAVWVLAAAEKAGVKGGITLSEAREVLEKVAGIRVHTVSLARVAHGHGELIRCGAGGAGGSKRYGLTAKGRTAVQQVPVR
ncbi:MAG: hypothetical protein AAF471_03550 [Myxococcota bacterium]